MARHPTKSKYALAGPPVALWAANPHYPGVWVCKNKKDARKLMYAIGATLLRNGCTGHYQHWLGISERPNSGPELLCTVVVIASTDN